MANTKISARLDAGKVLITLWSTPVRPTKPVAIQAVSLTASEAGDFLGELRKVVIAIEELQRVR